MAVTASPAGFVPPAYPYERLDSLRAIAGGLPGGAVDCSIGTPCDPPPTAVVEALGRSGRERGYPPSIGAPEYRQAAAGWLKRRLGVDVDPDAGLAACIGTKEFVVSLPHYLRLRNPDRNTVLYPAVSYPSYEMGAVLAGCRAVPVGVDHRFRIDLSQVSDADAARALCLWVNTPGNPAGGLDDLAEVAAWAQRRGVLVVSDECYAEFTWQGPPRSILQHSTDPAHRGVLALHSLSKRSNMAGVRAGFYAGDHQVVHYLRETRKHAGAMVPGPVQAAAVAAWQDQHHVDAQRELYRQRLNLLCEIAAASGATAELPAGAFYLWVPAPDGDAWAYARRLARDAGLIVSPGDFYCSDAAAGLGNGGADPTSHVRMAAVQPEERLRLALQRLSS